MSQTATLVLTQRQTSHLLSALYDKVGETKRYLSSYPSSDQPGPLDSCCAAHLERFQENLRQRAALLERQRDTQGLIDMFEAATFSEQAPLTVRPADADLVYRASDGELLRQPVSDVATVGTLIDPETGDDLEVITVSLRNHTQ